MATAPDTTGAPTRAPDFRKTLSAFETIHGDFATLQGVIVAAANDIGPEGVSKSTMHLIEAAVIVAKRLDEQFAEAVEAAYADLRGEG